MADPAKGKQPAGRSRFITWFLLGTGAAVAFLALCQRQGTLEKLDEWEFHLRSARRVLFLTGDPALRSSRVPGLEIVDASGRPELAALADGDDDAALAEAMRAGGFGGVVVGSDPPAGSSVRGRMEGFLSPDHFRCLMIRSEGALYAPARPVSVEDRVLEFLVRAARMRLAGAAEEDVLIGAPNGAKAGGRDGGFEVALQLQGLGPRSVNTAGARRIRHDLYASGVGVTLLDATLAAAEEIAGRYERRYEAGEGPLEETIVRLRIELHVLHDFALIDHAADGLDDAQYRSFMGRAIVPGVHGLAINWTPPARGRALGRSGFRLRLPPDAIYWGRQAGEQVLERVLTDARIGKLEDLRTSAHVSLDRFRSIHVMEREPGGRVVRMARGIAAEPPAEPPRESLARVASKIARDMDEDGGIALSYYPVRDLEWLGRGQAGRNEAHLQGLGVAALNAAARALDDESLEAAADRALGRMMHRVRACAGASVPFVEAEPPELPAITRAQVLAHCGPVDVTGRPVAVDAWGPDGKGGAPVPEDLVFVVHDSTARLGTAALVLLGLLDHLGHEPPRERRTRLEPLVRGLVSFILLMQREDGSFCSHFVVRDHGRASFDEPGDAGLALLALSRSLDHVSDERIEPALERGFAAHVTFVEELAAGSTLSATTCQRLEGYVPWVVLAASSVAEPSANVRRAGLVGLDRLLGGCPHPGRSGRGPGARDVLVAAAAAAALDMLETGERPAMAEAVARGQALASRLIVTPGVNDHFYPVPGRAVDGVGHDLLDHRQRTDHAFAVVALLSRLVPV